MSAELAVRGAVIAALKDDDGLMDGINGLFDGAPARASPPYAVVGECLGADWGAKDVEGRELRLSISLHDAGESTARLAALLGRVEPALQGARDRAGGWWAGDWRIVTVRLLRSRIARAGGRSESGWQAVIDYRIRAVREAVPLT